MRISVNPSDPGFNLRQIHGVTILFNGNPTKGVITADEEKGEIVVLKKNEQGRFMMDGDGIQTETLYGRVCILFMGNVGR